MSSSPTAPLHLVVGSGPIGSAVARHLVSQGARVKVLTRSGTGPTGCELLRGDASDAALMSSLCQGVSVLYNCVNPPYHRWALDWPPINHSLIDAAANSGAVLVTIANVYGYGPARASIGAPSYDAAHPMTEDTPLAATTSKGQVRARMWHEQRDAFDAGRAKVVEVRASDYIGPRADSVVGSRFVPRVLGGKSVTTIGRSDVAHSFTYTEDVARLAVVVGTDQRAWGKAWHTPSNDPRTQQEVADDIAACAGVKRVRVRALPGRVLYALGFFSRLLRELRQTEYQFRDEFVMDSSLAQRTFNLAPTPWSEIITTTVAYYASAGDQLEKQSVR
ncbi:MAG: NAD-dependent epimerase/dehydratase family protein [Acidimicrobiales bacterium]